MKRDSTYRGLESLGRTGNRLAKPPPEEPDAGKPHVRVCEGPGRQRPGLLGNGKLGSVMIPVLLATFTFGQTHAHTTESSKGVACWRGPFGSGACPDNGEALIDDLSKATLLWISEDRGCSIGYGAGGVDRNKVITFRSGYASPVVVDGRVYFAYFVPTGWDPEPGKDFTAEDFAKAKQLAESWVGDDVILCADAATGKTIWRKVFKGNAIHYKTSSKYGTHITPCVADGKVFCLGSGGATYGLNAKTGEVLWQGTVGDAYTKHKTGRDAGQPPGGRYHFSSCPNYAEGVVLFNDHSGSLLGLDPMTGKELYRTKGAMGGVTSPIRWPCGTRTYIMSYGKCFDPKTGTLLWKTDIGMGFSASGSYAVGEGYMVTAGDHGTKSAKEDNEEKGNAIGKTGVSVASNKELTGVTCFKIDEKGSTKRWALEAKYRSGHSGTLIYRGYAYFQTGHELVCVELKTGKIVNEEPVSNPNPCTAPVGYEGKIFMMHAPGVQLFSDGSSGMKRLGTPLAPPREGTITPYVADGKLFFRGPNHLCCYDLKKP